MSLFCLDELEQPHGGPRLGQQYVGADLWAFLVAGLQATALNEGVRLTFNECCLRPLSQFIDRAMCTSGRIAGLRVFSVSPLEDCAPVFRSLFSLPRYKLLRLWWVLYYLV